ncbi:hypothetical protein Pcinc_039083 [Petrolisthes cinctipes]|uniref:Uncharacterized protein n=1 Tax=Petrolisthes cinctipes TaxID=88211 RepID=A0AAE1BP66_PETCI|nr:hypothetical protein Pcinc_039083 [Petrolisthes cinctipes]
MGKNGGVGGMVAGGRQDRGHKVGMCLPLRSLQLQTRHWQDVLFITLPLFFGVKYFTVVRRVIIPEAVV